MMQVTSVLRHRGPDQIGVWESGEASLGAVRLKIIDLEGGNQPVCAEDKQTVIVFNGEIYNHAALREELEARGHRFESRCDTEVVLHAFLEWDTECFARLRGMFAMAIWSERERRLVLARDRMGIKPLYYCKLGRNLYFGSELKAILEHPEIPRLLSPEGLNYYLSLNYVPSPYTLVEGIRKLPPGCWLEWRAGEVRKETWWRLRHAPVVTGREEAKQELDELLRLAVAEHLIADVPLGVWASGGLDSSTILHYAAEVSGRRLKTFSVSFSGRKFDESRWFREVAARYGTEHYEFDLSPEEDIAGTVEELVYYSDEPSADAGALPVWYLSRMSREQVTVVLSGEGADELFGGYTTYLADRYAAWARRTPAFLRRLGLEAVKLLPVSDEKVGLDYKLRRFLEGSLLEPAEAHHYWNGTFSAAQRRRLLTPASWRDVPRLVDTLPHPAGGLRPLERFLWLDQLYYLPDDILYKCDRVSMAHSLEVRPAFLDHRIVEFAARLPEDLKVRGSVLKFILRDLMWDKLPRAVLTRRKEGFDIPAHEWFRTVLRELLADTVTEQAVKESGFLRWAEVRKVMEEHFARRVNLGYHLWGLLVLFLWIRRWRVETHPQLAEARSRVPIRH